jgi:prepilin-type N-terminal cleavage/methylation domain-containing protein
MKRNQSGHTLLELLVVVLILGILAGIAIPAASVGDDRKLDTLQLAIQDAIDHAQSLSFHQGIAYGVRFNVNGQWFAVVNENGVPVDDPLSHGDYLIRLTNPSPDMPNGCKLDYAMFGPRPLACFDEKGVLVRGGEVRITAGKTQRILTCTTANSTLSSNEPNSN